MAAKLNPFTGKLDLTGSASGAPTDATYITQTANGTLSAEQALASLSSGIMRVATTTGVITSLGDVLPIANGGTNNSSAYTAGSVVFSDGTSLTQDNTNLFWDDANNRLSTSAINYVGGNRTYRVSTRSLDSEDRLTFERVSGDNNGRFWFDTTAGNTGFSLSEVGTEKAYFGTLDGTKVAFLAYNGYDFAVYTSPSGFGSAVIRLYIDDSSGNVGIGTSTSPGSKLDVQGSFQADSITNDTGLAAGTFTPTRSAESNLDANVTMTEAQYMRVGNTVTMSGRVTGVDPTAPGAASFEFTLPVASNLGAVEDLAGVGFCGAIAGQGAAITGSVANNTAVFSWIAADLTSQSWSYTLTYQVI